MRVSHSQSIWRDKVQMVPLHPSMIDMRVLHRCLTLTRRLPEQGHCCTVASRWLVRKLRGYLSENDRVFSITGSYFNVLQV